MGKGLNNCLTWLFHTGLELWVVCDECCFIVWRGDKVGFWNENVLLCTRAHAYIGEVFVGMRGVNIRKPQIKIRGFAVCNAV